MQISHIGDDGLEWEIASNLFGCDRSLRLEWAQSLFILFYPFWWKKLLLSLRVLAYLKTVLPIARSDNYA